MRQTTFASKSSNFNKNVVTIKFNRAVAEELTKHIDPAEPDKTLIFAAIDAHADIVKSLASRRHLSSDMARLKVRR